MEFLRKGFEERGFKVSEAFLREAAGRLGGLSRLIRASFNVKCGAL